jgi:hypothetical protein
MKLFIFDEFGKARVSNAFGSSAFLLSGAEGDSVISFDGGDIYAIAFNSGGSMKFGITWNDMYKAVTVMEGLENFTPNTDIDGDIFETVSYDEIYQDFKDWCYRTIKY